MGADQSRPATYPQREMADPNFIREQELMLREINDANRRNVRQTEKTTEVAGQMLSSTREEAKRAESEEAQVNRPTSQNNDEEIRMQKRILKIKQKEMQKKNEEIEKQKEELKQKREDLSKMKQMLEDKKALELQLATIKMRAENAEAKLKESTQYSMKDPYHYTAPSLDNIHQNQNGQVSADTSRLFPSRVVVSQNRSSQRDGNAHSIAVGQSTVPSPPVASPHQHDDVKLAAASDLSVQPPVIVKQMNDHQEKVVDLHNKTQASNDQLANTSKKKRKRRKAAQNTSQAQEASQEKNIAAKSKNMPNSKTSNSNFDVVNIGDNSIGMDYETIFRRFLGSHVTSVKVEDPFIQGGFQIMNFVKFCELLVVKCKNLKMISLLTNLASQKKQNAQEEQQFQLHQLKESLNEHNINLVIEFSKNLHNKEISFSTGWVIQIGRGLNIYKNTKNIYSIGYTDYRLRKCYQTSINIFHRSIVSITNVQ